VRLREAGGLALATLRVHTLRTVLAISGIAVGVAAVVAVLAIGNASHQRMKERIESLGANLLVVAPAVRQTPARG
jgi:ABC-type antimicrobial peptide transport system permease subunit